MLKSCGTDPCSFWKNIEILSLTLRLFLKQATFCLAPIPTGIRVSVGGVFRVFNRALALRRVYQGATGGRVAIFLMGAIILIR